MLGMTHLFTLASATFITIIHVALPKSIIWLTLLQCHVMTLYHNNVNYVRAMELIT